MPTRKSSDEEADFSSFFNKQEELKTKTERTAALQELPTQKLVTKKIKTLLVIFLVLAIAQFVLYYITQKSKYPGIPEGYKIISTEGQPPKVVPVK